MEAVMIETQGVIASSSLEAGKYDGEGGEGGTSEQPTIDGDGFIFGD